MSCNYYSHLEVNTKVTQIKRKKSRDVNKENLVFEYYNIIVLSYLSTSFLLRRFSQLPMSGMNVALTQARMWCQGLSMTTPNLAASGLNSLVK